MLKEIDVIVYDIQDIGCRSYTYTTTLCYVMEEAAKKGIPVIVLDRPNPINGLDRRWADAAESNGAPTSVMSMCLIAME